jgi:hypothetical protein
MDRSEIVDSYVGFWFVSATGILRRSLVSGCTYGVVSEFAATNVRLSQSAITSNGWGAYILTSGTITSFGNNEIAGNGTDVTGSLTTAMLQ